MKNIPWDNPDSNILDDIAAAAEMIRESSGIAPNTIVCNLKQYAYLVLGRFVVALQCGLDWAYSYQLPKSTFKDHLRDCFGWPSS